MADRVRPDITVERCTAYDHTCGRCQLVLSHDGVHALQSDDAYLTWTVVTQVYRWSRTQPPTWLLSLAWMPGAQPALRPVEA